MIFATGRAAARICEMCLSYKRRHSHDGPMITEARALGRAGRPRLHSSPTEARRAANGRRKAKLQNDGLAQRSVWLPKELWEALRSARLANETSDVATLERILRQALL